MLISVVVPTHDRRASVLRLLRALGNGGVPPERMEVLVVADGCSDDTVASVRDEEYAFPVEVIEQTPARGSAAARNLGAGRARGELLVFLDDDIEPFPGMLGEHERAHRELGEIGAVVGPSHPVRRTGADWASLGVWAWWEERFAEMERLGHRFRYDDVFSGNLSIPADFFARLGGFDPEIHCGHDYELGMRVLKAGGRVAYAPRAGGWHHEARDLAGIRRRKSEEGRGDVELVRRHPELWPTLPLSRPWPRARTLSGALRRLAFGAPHLGDAIAAWLHALQRVQEFFRMRRAWRRTRARLTSYSYWRGVATAVGNRRAWRAACERWKEAPRTPVRELEFDLRGGLAPAERLLDDERPDAVRIRWGSLVVGTIPPQPGAEPLRGVHLRPALMADFFHALVAALATSETMGEPSAGAAPGGSPSVATVPADSVDPPLAARDPTTPGSGTGVTPPLFRRLKATLPIRVLDLEVGGGVRPVELGGAYGGAHILLRRGGRPMGWATLIARGRVVDPEEIAAGFHRSGGGAAQALLDALGPEVEAHSPPISVVICTRDRPDLLARCLHSVALLDYPAYEVIVVDNAPSTDATERLTAAAGVRYVREPLPGLDRARNRGLAEARCGIVAYTDDDVEVDPRWLAGIARGFADPQVSAVTGLILPAALDTEAELLFELGYGGMGKGMLPRYWNPATLPASKILASQHVGVGANMAFRREGLERLGGFDTALDVGMPARGGGDLDVFHRVLASGGVIQYEPMAIVRHHHRRDMAALESQLRDNGRAFGVYLLKILRRGSVRRIAVVRYVLRVWWPWLLGRMVRGFLGREELPDRLLRAELRGAVGAPGAYLAAYRQDRRLSRNGVAISASDVSQGG